MAHAKRALQGHGPIIIANPCQGARCNNDLVPFSGLQTFALFVQVLSVHLSGFLAVGLEIPRVCRRGDAHVRGIQQSLPLHAVLPCQLLGLRRLP
jgi:hypothetical protein